MTFNSVKEFVNWLIDNEGEILAEEAKAKELVEKFQEIEVGSAGFHSWGLDDYQAKQCAIILCDEILNLKGNSSVKDAAKGYEFWEGVKEAINHL